MIKRYLCTPGPTPVPEEIMLEMARPVMHHRTAEFKALLKEAIDGLKWLYRTKNDVLLLASSGTGGMEAAVVNFFNRGDRVIVISAGKFGERWANLAKAYGLSATVIDVPWGTAVTVEQVRAALTPETRGIFIQASETSTGVRHPVREVAALIRGRDDALMVVDAVTGLGVFDIRTDEWGLDVVVAGSQKALMLPPGLAFVAVSERAWKMNAGCTQARFYFDLARERKNQAQGQTAWTPAVSLVRGLAASLKMIRAEGLEVVFARHERLAAATRAGIRALGCRVFGEGVESPALSVAVLPDGTEAEAVRKAIDGRYGIKLAGGQDQLKGRVVRIAHLGWFDEWDVIAAVAALGRALADAGLPDRTGEAVSAMTAAFGGDR